MSGRLIPEQVHNAVSDSVLHEGPLARMAREAKSAFDAAAIEAMTGPLSELADKWPGDEIDGVSGDLLAWLRLRRYIVFPRLNLWVRAAERVVSAEAEAMARRMHEARSGTFVSWARATTSQRNYWRLEAAKRLSGGDPL